MPYHWPCRPLDDEEAAIGRYLNGLPNRFGIEFGDRAMCARTGVVDDDIGLPSRVSASSNKRATAAGFDASTSKVSAPVSAASVVSLSTLRAPRPNPGQAWTGFGHGSLPGLRQLYHTAASIPFGHFELHETALLEWAQKVP
jgi:hypothetical protein